MGIASSVPEVGEIVRVRQRSYLVGQTAPPVNTGWDDALDYTRPSEARGLSGDGCIALRDERANGHCYDPDSSYEAMTVQ